MKPAGRGIHHLIQSQVGKEGFEAFGDGNKGRGDIGRQLVQLTVGRQLIELVAHGCHLSLDVIRPAAVAYGFGEQLKPVFHVRPEARQGLHVLLGRAHGAGAHLGNQGLYHIGTEFALLRQLPKHLHVLPGGLF
ncbi:hypothetical protein E1189_02245, partial [Sansalvadorimonas verongulae]|nr:hypothetical protein [Sansalvadorimonas verongulae]